MSDLHAIFTDGLKRGALYALIREIGATVPLCIGRNISNISFKGFVRLKSLYLDLRDCLQSALITWPGSKFHSIIALYETVLLRKFVYEFGSFKAVALFPVLWL